MGIETTAIVEMEETEFVSGESSTARKDLDYTATVEMEETTFMPAMVEKNIETTSAEEREETTFVPVEAVTSKKEIETTAAVKMDTTSFVTGESSTTRKDLESAATVENEETTFMPTTAKKDFIRTTTEDIEEITFAPSMVSIEPKQRTESDSLLVQDKTILPIQLTPSGIENENIIIPENEIFLPFFDEEGSGSEKSQEELVEVENKRREPRIMDDPVLKFLTYRTETSVSKVERA